MRPITVRQSAAGFTQWIPVNRLQTDFDVGIGVEISSGGSLTYSVEHTFDQLYSDLWNLNFVKIARATTTATVTTKTSHGLTAGDWVQILNSGSSVLDGTFSVATVGSATTFTYTVANSGPTADGGLATLQSARVFPNIILAGVTTRGDTNYSAPIVAVRLNVTTYGSGFADMQVIQGV